MTEDACREETSKFAALSGCTYNDEISFVGIELSLLFVIQREISLPLKNNFLFLLIETYLLRMSGSR